MNTRDLLSWDNGKGTQEDPREHLMAVEWDSTYGRAWNVDIPESEVTAFIQQYESSVYSLSDVDHWTGCWCFKE